MTMAIRLATLAIVPVKRVCRLVNPVSKGEAISADAIVGRRIRTNVAAATNKLRRLLCWRRAFTVPRRIVKRNRMDIGYLQRSSSSRDMPAKVVPFHPQSPINFREIVIPGRNIRYYRRKEVAAQRACGLPCTGPLDKEMR